jgi:hypothetical protein
MEVFRIRKEVTASPAFRPEEQEFPELNEARKMRMQGQDAVRPCPRTLQERGLGRPCLKGLNRRGS